MANTSFSVLISSFNYANYVVDTVRSALAQTHPPIQVIIVDDGSVDDSVATLRQAFEGDRLVKIISKENGGQMSSWIEGLRLVEGDVVALLDSDDLWTPRYLERNAAVFAADPSVDYVYCNMELFGTRSGLRLKKRRHQTDRDLGLSVLLGAFVQRWQGIATSGNCIRRELLRELLSLPAADIPAWKSRPDDCLFYGSDILGAHKYYLAEPLVRHREHTRNAKLEFSNAPLKLARYAIQFEKMLDHYRRRMGISASWLRLAKHEFRSKSAPDFSEWLIYSGLALRAPIRFSACINQIAAITAHYLRSRWRRVAGGTRLAVASVPKGPEG